MENAEHSGSHIVSTQLMTVIIMSTTSIQARTSGTITTKAKKLSPWESQGSHHWPGATGWSKVLSTLIVYCIHFKNSFPPPPPSHPVLSNRILYRKDQSQSPERLDNQTRPLQCKTLYHLMAHPIKYLFSIWGRRGKRSVPDSRSWVPSHT